eukprot:231771-Amphidinium_carterae.1
MERLVFGIEYSKERKYFHKQLRIADCKHHFKSVLDMCKTAVSILITEGLREVLGILAGETGLQKSPSVPVGQAGKGCEQKCDRLLFL